MDGVPQRSTMNNNNAAADSTDSPQFETVCHLGHYTDDPTTYSIKPYGSNDKQLSGPFPTLEAAYAHANRKNRLLKALTAAHVEAEAAYQAAKVAAEVAYRAASKAETALWMLEHEA